MEKTEQKPEQKQPTEAQTLLGVLDLAMRMRSLLIMMSAPFPSGSLADGIFRDAVAAAPHIQRAIEIAKDLAKEPAAGEEKKEPPAP